MKTALWWCAAGLSLACYTYVPASLDAVAPGTAVRALLSTEVQLALRDSMGLRQQRVRGTLVDRQADRLLLAVRSDGGDGSGQPHALYQRVVLAQRDVLQLEVKRLDRGRTAGVLGVLAAAATLVVIEAIRRGNPGTAQPPGGGPPD